MFRIANRLFILALIFLPAGPIFSGHFPKEDKNLLELVGLAKKKLKKEEKTDIKIGVDEYLLRAKDKDKKIKRTRKIFYVAEKPLVLATLGVDGNIRFIRVKMGRRGRKDKFSVFNVDPPFCSVESEGGGGVGERFNVLCNGVRELPLASLRMDTRDVLSASRAELEKNVKPIIYSAYYDDFTLPEIVSSGREYIVTQILSARDDLARKGVKSRAVRGKLVTEVFPEDILFDLSFIEHIDHNEFREMGADYTGKKVLTQLAMNREDAFRYATSRAGAMCLMQLMSGTYLEIKSKYSEARLPQSAREGACSSHKLAIEAAYLVLDDKLLHMPGSFKDKFMEDPDTYGIYLAVAYNGGASRAAGLYEKMQPSRVKEILNDFYGIFSPRDKKFRVIRQETWIFIKKYMEIENVFLK